MIHTEKGKMSATLSCDKTVAIVCSLIFILCSPLICITGLICGCICQNQKLQLETGSSPSTHGTLNDARLKEAYSLDENIAYDTVQEYSIIHT